VKQYSVAFDASMITDKNAGIGYLAKELLIALADQNVKVWAFSNKDIPNMHKNIVVVKVLGSINIFWHLKTLRKMKQLNIDAIVSPSNFIYGFLSSKTIQIVHDIAPIRFPDHYGFFSAFKFKLFLKLASLRAMAIATISKTTAEDIIRLFTGLEDKIFVIGVGLNSHVLSSEEVSLEIFKKYQVVPKKYILSVGTLQPRKNYETAIKAFSKFKKYNPEYKYVIAGNYGWKYTSILELIKKLGIKDDVVITGFVEEKDLRTFYKYARIYLNTSYWEGFGLPLIEAYYYKLPIVASDIPIFHEVMGNKAIYVHHTDPAEIQAGLSKALNKKNMKRNLSFLSKYDWDKVAQKIIEILDKNLTKE
jgi:glycosyltransferase involved in cell wall biosynthesis